MDEVDSALDEMNIERFLSLLTELKDQYQFILITHQPKTIEEAQYVYGITMETPGISKVISLRMQ
jgi:chromosome segregation protein